MSVELGWQIIDRPPDERQFHAKQQKIGKFYSPKKTLKEDNLGYYLVRLYLKADLQTLEKIDKVVYHLSSSLKPDVTKSNPKNEFASFVTLFDRTPEVGYTIYWKDKTQSTLKKIFDLKSAESGT